jgi:hypothetical protein
MAGSKANGASKPKCVGSPNTDDSMDRHPLCQPVTAVSDDFRTNNVATVITGEK